MTFGERLTQVRKRKNLSQAEIGKKIGINGNAYGRYERNDVRPTIEMATQLADTLVVSIDYLVGKIDIEVDKSIVEKLRLLDQLDEEEKNALIKIINSMLTKKRMKDLLDGKASF